MSQTTVNLKPLVWTDPAPPNAKGIRYDHVTAESPLGQYSIEWKSWKERDTYDMYLTGWHIESCLGLDEAKQAANDHMASMVLACLEPAHAPDDIDKPVALAVWYGSMPESNGKTNWTAILHRKGEGLLDGVNITLDRSEYPDRVRYEADRMRYLIGELPDEPDMMAYDEKLHSGYVKPKQDAVMDLDAIDWASILQAASESTWMPPEYMRNDWVADVCAFLRERPEFDQQPVEFDYPQYREEGMGCGLEDRGITDRYEACRYGFDCAVDEFAAIIESLGLLYAHPVAPDASLAREAALREELANLAELKAYVTIPLRERCAERKSFQQRLEAAEQRNATLEKILDECRYNFNFNKTETMLTAIIDELLAKTTESGASEAERKEDDEALQRRHDQERADYFNCLDGA